MRKENELEKVARKHRKKQKYPMSIFPDYKKGAEEFNKNSTPINQDALSSADASSGMAEGIRRNKKKGINEEMNSDFLYWEIAEPQCTGYDCDDNIEYVYGDNEDRVWIEQDGRKYKVFVNEWDVKPTATFTSLSKAKAFGEKYWQDNYGYVNESLNESNDEDMGYRLGKWLGARLLTGWTAMLNVDGAEESPDYDEYDQQFDGTFVQCLNKLKEYQDIIDQDGIDAYLALQSSHGEYFDGDYDRIIDKLYDRGYLYDNDLEESFNMSDETIEDAIEYYRENAFGFDGLKDYVETDFSHLPKETRNEIYNKMKKKLDESLNEDSEYFYSIYDSTAEQYNRETPEKQKSQFGFIIERGDKKHLKIIFYEQKKWERKVFYTAVLAFKTTEEQLKYARGLIAIDKNNTSGVVSKVLEEVIPLQKKQMNPLKKLTKKFTNMVRNKKKNESLNESEKPVKMNESADSNLWDEIDDVLDEFGVKYKHDKNNGYGLIEFWTDTAGQDVPTEFDYDGTPEGFINAFWDSANSYDAEEEVECYKEWLGKRGVPDDIETLEADCEEARDTLISIAEELNRLLLNRNRDEEVNESLDKSLNEDCNSYQYKGKTIINAGDYWFVKGYEEKFPTSDEAEEFVDDMKKDEGLEDKFRGPKPLRSFDDVLKAEKNREKLYYYEDGVGNDDNPIPVVVAGRPNKFQIPLARLGVDEPYTFTIMDFRNLSRDKAGNLDKLANESMKINIRESLNKMDAESDNTYDLLNLYESKNLSKRQKKNIARMIYENYGLERIYNYLYEATEEEDELPVEDRVKELTNNFKNTNGSYVFEEVQDANKAVTILKSRGYEASQKRTQDGKYRVTADKKNK